MTNKRVELIDEVRTLDLEVRKLELENRLTQLKAEQLIDDDCVGCAGPCDVTKLQKKFDEYKETVRLARIEHVDMLRAVNQHHHAELDKFRKLALNESRRVECDTELIEKLHNEHRTEISKLRAENIEDLKELYDLAKEELDELKHQLDVCIGSGTAHAVHIGGLKKPINEEDRMLEKYGDKIICLRKMYDGVGGRVHARAAYIEGLKKELSICKQNEDDFKGKFVEQAQLNGVLLGQIGDLKTELVDKNKDSEVLKKVVEMLKNWDDTSGHAFPILYGLVDLLVDYLDVPEELDIDGHQDISIAVALLEVP